MARESYSSIFSACLVACLLLSVLSASLPSTGTFNNFTANMFSEWPIFLAILGCVAGLALGRWLQQRVVRSLAYASWILLTFGGVAFCTLALSLL